MNMIGVGLSLVSAASRELLYAQADGLSLDYLVSSKGFELTARLRHFQV